jgi:NhaP-type Na+/H+ or K+/H+ antiporter
VFRRFNPRATKRVTVLIGLSILLFRLEHLLENLLPFASLVAVMAVGFIILEREERMAHEISSKLAKIWVLAEVALFTLVGAQVDITVALEAGLAGGLLIFLGLVARSIGSWVCTAKSPLTVRERLFVVVAYCPKATVQAAIGGAALIMMQQLKLPTRPGEVILAVAVLSIVLTAPAGAWAISYLGHRWLSDDGTGS